MARALRLALGSLAALFMIAAAALFGLYRAVQHVPPLYQQVLLVDGEAVDHHVRELESRAGALYSDTQQAGLEWSASFSAEQVNAWLASAFEMQFGGELIHTVKQPRIHIAPDGITFGFRTQQAGVDSVVSIHADLFLTEANELAIRIADVRAGLIPIPAQPFIDEFLREARHHDWPIRWTQQGGDPVALLAIPDRVGKRSRRLRLDTIELLEGELYIAGRTLEESTETPEADGESLSEAISLDAWQRAFEVQEEESEESESLPTNGHRQAIDESDAEFHQHPEDVSPAQFDAADLSEAGQ